MKSKFKKLVSELKNNSIEEKVAADFLSRIVSGIPLTKEDSLHDHFCSFFVPVSKDLKHVYLGHHIKADDWIPPGGHIKKDEDPLLTVIREFEEELNHKLTSEKITLFSISITDIINNPRHQCKKHYDFWYVVFVDQINFNYIKKEYYNAGWFTFEEMEKKTKNEKYKNKIRLIKSLSPQTKLI